MRTLLAAMAVAVLAFCAAAVHAEEKQKVILSITSEVERVVVGAEGKREIKYLDSAKATFVPGDVVLYSIKYQNVSKEAVSNIVINNPIPREMAYKAGSAEGEGTDILFSVDGGKSFAQPEKLLVTDKEGNKKQAGAADYTNVKWTVKGSLPAGKSGKVTYKAIIK